MDIDEKKLLIKLAYGYYQNGEYKKAIALYKKIYEADPEDFNVMNMMADTYMRNEEKDMALESYVTAVSLLEKKEQHEKCIKLAKKALKYFPDDQRVKNKQKSAIRSMIRAAEKKVLNREYEPAREIYEYLKEFNSEDFPINIKMKELSDEEQKHIERARSIQETKEVKKPEDPQKDLISKFDDMAQNYIKNNDFDGAVETYITALKLSPNNPGLKAKLHEVYMLIAQSRSAEQVWAKVDSSPASKLEEAKRRAVEERQNKIMNEEENRARLIIEEERKMQEELELEEMEVIKKAAEELKQKIDEAQKEHTLKEEEIKRITEEQNRKKEDLLEKLKKEAVDKWKKQKENMMEKAMEAKKAAAEPEKAFESPNPQAQPKRSQADLMALLHKAYEVPKVGEQEAAPVKTEPVKPEPAVAAVQTEPVKPVPTAAPVKVEPPKPALNLPPSLVRAQKEESIMDDIGESESKNKTLSEEVIINEDTLDSLITTAYIFINQNLIKEAMKLLNKISEKYPNNPEVRAVLQEIAKKQNL